jgi:hypothetical protein
MKRKIHITEEQLEYIRKSLTEEDEITVDAQPNPVTGKITTQDLTQQYNNATKKTNGNTRVKLTVDGADLTEDSAKPVTKRQIREAKIEKLQENTVVYKKKNLK